MRFVTSLIAIAACVFLGAAIAEERDSLTAELEPLRPFVGKTWKGEFPSSTPAKPVVDVMSWERALNGKAVRVLHSINDGAYGGETIYRWDGVKKEISYHYFTTAGFMTVGTARLEDGKLITHEVVSGSSGGVTEVRGTAELRSTGELFVKTEHLKEGKWSTGRELTYRLAPDAKVVFQ